MKALNKEFKFIEINDDMYPELLRNIHKPPKRLYYIGNLELLKKDKISIVGSRQGTTYGKWAAFNLAKRLSKKNVVVVSGMAYGIDTEAHIGALEGAAGTIAVLGTGIDICYPKSNSKLMKEIAAQGLILSEFEPGTPAAPYTFPLRNRIISGLSLATVVAEASIKSGSLITAEYASEQGREVYAIPGNLDRRSSFGCNRLIRDGANILVSFDDIVSDFGLGVIEENHIEGTNLSDDEKEIFKAVYKNGESSIDDISQMTNKTVPEVSGLVSLLEMKGYLHYYAGKVFIEK